MTTQQKLINKFGNPRDASFEAKNLTVWNIPVEYGTPFKKIYCNKALIEPLNRTFKQLKEKDLLKEIKTFDGCFIVRDIRGVPGVLSVHSWAMAVDFNAAHNPLGLTRAQAIQRGLIPFTEAFVDVWRKNGWTCGIDFSRGDGMHFEYVKPL